MLLAPGGVIRRHCWYRERNLNDAFARELPGR